LHEFYFRHTLRLSPFRPFLPPKESKLGITTINL